MKFANITVGGTFDLLHDGHKKLLDQAFIISEKVWVGITSDEFVVRSSKFIVEKYDKRKKELENYLKSRGWIDRAKIIPINDVYGTTLIDKNLQAIVVSPETLKTAKEINNLRKLKNWTELEIITVPWVLGKDGKSINSKRIRNGEIDRQGNLYILPKEWGIRYLPEKLRQEFKKPLGKLITCHPELTDNRHPELVSGSIYKNEMLKLIQHDRCIIAVGDATVVNLIKKGITPDISIIDLKVERKQKYKNIAELGFSNIKVHKNVDNPAGTVSFTVFKTLNSLIKDEAKPSVLQVNGEDDLLTLLAVFLAPLGYLIVYGQPSFAEATEGKHGVVLIVATEQTKNQARKYLDQFIK
ncbi:MAG: hypothetical protein UR52_C0024G0003 [Candidatus Gottesmanbacteria bacterium GW2011_GWA1_34_13]|uniref:Cytidyltransferase-like domain-containing protein n=1 Tax=Candidatus Gottesmanbacteria bacterium GW2011_GWA1_34_13 TaxID=1618434 RepID=A0A0G0DRZ0_9BACT|nr:MAG: hypothetical protein UR52_C0024G0003 [Candidatus Gottesmanbacteria bacterium GW2011_GWA1_34_13]